MRCASLFKRSNQLNRFRLLVTDGALAELLPYDKQYKFAKSCLKWHKDTDIELSERTIVDFAKMKVEEIVKEQNKLTRVCIMGF